MLTRESYNKVLGSQVTYYATKLIDFLNDQGLTPTTDINAIKQELKVKLFNQLLEADPGLRARLDIMRTDSAKEQLLQQTVSLDGYDEIGQVASLINEFHRAFSSVYGIGSSKPFMDHGISAEQFITLYGGSVEAALGDKIIDLSDSEVSKKVEGIVEAINWLINKDVVRGDNHVFYGLQRLISINIDKKEVAVNQEAIYHQEANKGRRLNPY